MSQTGHKTENQCLEYVGKNTKTHAIGLAKELDPLERNNAFRKGIKKGTNP